MSEDFKNKNENAGVGDSGRSRQPHHHQYNNWPERVREASHLSKKAAEATTRAAIAAGKSISNVSYTHGIHPGLVPGMSVDDRDMDYRTDKTAVVVTGLLIGGFVLWGLISTDSLTSISSAALTWVVTNTGWLFSMLAVVMLLFMVFVGFSRYGNIRLGLDNEKPEYSFGSWVAMLFSAGMGIGLMFFGTYEPMTYFHTPPPGMDVAPNSYDALNGAMAQTMLHWGLSAWAFYAFVGGAIAYGAYRRGRVPLLSRVFVPLLGRKRAVGPIGRVIDVLAIVATLFGTSASLGIGATQIARGLEIVGGIGKIGNAGLIMIICVLTIIFIASAVSGVSRGIRWLSNINMTAAFLLLIFVFFAGPTIFLLDLVPTTVMHYLATAPELLSKSAAWGPEAGDFASAWTVFYWAWWISWSPFVGVFIAKISRGRTLRQFVSVVLVIPTVVSMMAFIIFGGTAINFELHGVNLSEGKTPEELLFSLLHQLPLAQVTPLVAMFCITVFFVTSADSASVVMGTLSQQGRPEPNRYIVGFWGLCLTGIAIVGLLIGETSAIKGLQNLIIVSSLPFAVVVAFMMVAWLRDLQTDPYTIRNDYAKEALRGAVRKGMERHGDDFQIVVAPAPEGEGAGRNFDSEDPAVSEWYSHADAPQAIAEGTERVAAQNAALGEAAKQ